MKRWALALVAGGVLWPSSASAYCRTTTCDPYHRDSMRACVLDDDFCAINGDPLIWPSSCVSLAVHDAGSPLRGVSYDDARELALEAFDQWLGVDCGGMPPSIELVDLGPALCGEGEYNSQHPNANVLLFRDDSWPHDEPDATLALTIVTFNTVTGEIYDTDIEVNSFNTDVSINGSPNSYDLASILTHEAGHFFGFGHSWVAGSTMREGGSPGDTSMRTLSADDADGMCTAYPPRRSTRSTECRPRHGFSPECAPNESSGCGCRQGSPPETPVPPMLAGVVGLVALRLGAWRRRAAASRP